MQAMNALVDQVLSVSKAEIQRRQAEYLETVRNNPNRRGPKIRSQKSTTSEKTMETPDGWKFVCKICGKDHEVPEQFAPYWDHGALKRLIAGEVEVPCAEAVDQTRLYTFTDFTPYRVA